MDVDVTFPISLPWTSQFSLTTITDSQDHLGFSTWPIGLL